MTKLVEAPQFKIKKLTEFKPHSSAAKKQEVIERHRPFGMRPQEITAPTTEEKTIYDPKEQRTDIDLTRSAIDIINSATAWSLTNGKIDDV